MTDVVDLAVIGSGGAAFAAAIAARRKHKQVVMIERDTTGGTCVNTGCVPSKALLAAADARHVTLTADRFPGISASADQVAFDQLIAGKDTLVAGVRADKYTDLAAAYGWEILHGEARFVPGPALQATRGDGQTTWVDAEHYLVATGSTPWAPPIHGLADAGYLTSTTAMALERLPASLLILGGGSVSLEQAQLFARLGTQVTVVARSRLASREEPEVSAVIQQVFTDEGIRVHPYTQLTHVTRDERGYVARIRDRHGEVGELRAEQLLVATGRRPVTATLGLTGVGVKTGEHGEVVTDAHLRTHNPRIWAAGDVTGHPQYVYVAAAHGTLVADNAFDHAGRILNYHHLPRVTFTSPQIASAGMTDTEAINAGIRCDCRVLPLEHVPRALVNRDTRGLVKLVADTDTRRLLGAHVIAEGAGDVIAAAVYALAQSMTVDEIAATWSPYLTMAEALKLAAQTYTRDVSKLSCCAA